MNHFSQRATTPLGKQQNNKPFTNPFTKNKQPPLFFWWVQTFKTNKPHLHSHPYGCPFKTVESFCQAKARDFLVLTFGDLPQQLLEVSRGGVGGGEKGQLNHRYENWGKIVQVIVSIYIYKYIVKYMYCV